jgi:phosphotransferase system HPr (HPr) family protein
VSKTVERGFTIRSELGLHARPAGEFAVMAGRFESEIMVGDGREWVDGRSVLSLLSFAAGRGVELRIRATGSDADEAVTALGALLERSRVEIESAKAG